MMKCLFGTYQKDEGTIVLDGKEVNFSGPKDALENGVAMVHQELNQCLMFLFSFFLRRSPQRNSLGIFQGTCYLQPFFTKKRKRSYDRR